MARLRSVNLKVTFDIYYDSQPVVVKYNGKKIDEVNFSIKSINQKEQIEAGQHGVPLSVYKDKFFFVQDRIDDLVSE